MSVPEVHYTRSGDVSIAYQVVGDGPMDVVFVRGTLAELKGVPGTWRLHAVVAA